uniref:MD-2-related lipid-recognition domain-containing protein n=1 Tax=Anopheles arabiensis TaxID=7173 RepID=A0A182HK71_ANOAR
MNKALAIGWTLALVWLSLAAMVDGVLYEIELNNFEAVPQEIDDFLEYGTIRLTRKGRNQLGVSGSFSVLTNAGKETLVRWIVYKYDFMGNRRMFVNGEGTLCEIIAKDELIYPNLLETSNMPPQDACPFPKGNYTINNFVMDEQRLPPAVPASDWLIETIITRGGKIGGGFRMNQITDVVFDSMIHLKPKREGIVDFGTLQVQNAGTNMCNINGKFSLLQSFGDDVTVSAKLYRKATGMNGIPYYMFSSTLCELIKKDTTIYPQLIEHSNFPVQDTCPVPKGNYTLRNFVLDMTKIPLVLPLGEWILLLQYSKNYEALAGQEIYFTIQPSVSNN